MAHTSGGNAGAYLRAFAERVRRSCRRMAQRLNCIPLQMLPLLLARRARGLLPGRLLPGRLLLAVGLQFTTGLLPARLPPRRAPV
ncbi:unnamed protein product, partial [Urochloa humidicola]